MIEVLFSVLIVILSLKLFPVNFGNERFEITRVIKKNYHGQKSTPFPRLTRVLECPLLRELIEDSNCL